MKLFFKMSVLADDKQKIMESEHFLVAEMDRVNRVHHDLTLFNSM